MISGMLKYIVMAVLVMWTLPSFACDGTPPKLVNKDDKAYEYELKCGKKTETRSIAAGASQSLKEKSGCTIKLGEGKAKKLYTEMVCTIKNAKLTCELL